MSWGSFFRIWWEILSLADPGDRLSLPQLLSSLSPRWGYVAWAIVTCIVDLVSPYAVGSKDA